MAEPLGVAEVQVTADNEKALSAIDAVIKKVAKLQADLDKAADSLTKLQGGQSPAPDTERLHAANEADLARRARGAAALGSQPGGRMQGDIRLTVDTRSILAQIQGAFRTYTFKINIDTADIVGQLRRQLNDAKLTVDASAGQQPSSAPARPAPAPAPYTPQVGVVGAVQTKYGQQMAKSDAATELAYMQRSASMISKVYERPVHSPTSTDPREIARFVEDAIKAANLNPSTFDSQRQVLRRGTPLPGTAVWAEDVARRSGAKGPVNASASLKQALPYITAGLAKYSPQAVASVVSAPPAVVAAATVQRQEAAAGQQAAEQQARDIRRVAAYQQREQNRRVAPPPGHAVTPEQLLEYALNQYGSTPAIHPRTPGTRPIPLTPRREEFLDREARTLSVALQEPFATQEAESIARGRLERVQGLRGRQRYMQDASRDVSAAGSEFGPSAGSGRTHRYRRSPGGGLIPLHDEMVARGRQMGVRITGDKSVIDETPALRGRDKADAMRLGLSINGVDVTPLARLAAEPDALQGWYRDQEGQMRKAPLDEEGKRAYPEGVTSHQRLSSQDILKRLIRRRVGAEIDNKILNPMMTAPDPGVAPVAGAATGYFWPFLEAGRAASASGHSVRRRHTKAGGGRVGNVLGPHRDGGPTFRKDIAGTWVPVESHQATTPQAGAVGERRRQFRYFGRDPGRGAAMGQGQRARMEFAPTAAGDEEAANDIYTGRRSRNALRIERGQMSEESADRLRGRPGRRQDLTMDELGKVIAERDARTELELDESMGAIHQISQGLIDPSTLPSVAGETVGRFTKGQAITGVTNNKGVTAPGSIYDQMEYLVHLMDAQYGVSAQLGVTNPLAQGPGSLAKIGKAWKKAPGGEIIGSAVSSLGSAATQGRLREQAAGDVRTATDNASITRDARKSIRTGTIPLRSRSRAEALTGDLERLPSEESIIARHSMLLAPRYATLKANADRGDSAGLSPTPPASGFEEGKSDTEIREGILAAAKKDLDERAARAQDITTRIERERRISDASHTLVDSVRGKPEGKKVYDEAGLTALATQSGVESDVKAQVVADLFRATHRTKKDGGVKAINLEEAIGEVYEVPAGRFHLNRGQGTPTEDLTGRSTTIPGDDVTSIHGEGMALSHRRRRRATRIAGEGEPAGEPGSKPSLLTSPEAGVAYAAEARGGLPPSIIARLREEQKQAAVTDAVSTAKNIDPGAGVMTVTIASPIPLPVTVVNFPSGSSGGADGGGKPPKGGKPTAEGGGEEKPPKPPKPPKATPEQTALQMQAEEEKLAREQGAIVEGWLGKGPLPLQSPDRYPNLGTVAGPGYRLPPLRPNPNLPSWMAPPAQQTGAGLDLEVAQTKAEENAQKQFEKENKAAEGERRRSRNLATQNNVLNIRQEKRAEDPLALQTLAYLRNKMGVPEIGPLPGGQEAALSLTGKEFSEARGVIAQRDRAAKSEAAAAAAGITGPTMATRAPTRGRLEQLVRSAGLITGNQSLAEGLPSAPFDPDKFTRDDDLTLQAQQRATAAIATQRGRISQRALSTTLVQLSENLFANREKPLGMLVQAEQERAQLGAISRDKRKAVEVGEQLQRDRVAAARTLGSGAYAKDSDQYKEVRASLHAFKKSIQENAVQVAHLTKLESDQAEKVVKLANSAVGASDVMRNLAAGFVGGVGGALVTQAVGVAAQAAMHGLTTVVIPQMDQAMGHGLTSQRIQKEQAAAFTQSGYSRSALLSGFGGQGFDLTKSLQLMDIVGEQAQAIAGAEQAQGRIDTNRAASALELQATEQGLPPGTPPGLFRGTGAMLSLPFGDKMLEWITGQNMDYMDFGGTDSSAKVMARAINDLPRQTDRAEERGIPWWQAMLGAKPSASVSPSESGLSDINQKLRAGGSGVRIASGQLDDATRKIMDDIEGAADLINALDNANLKLTNVSTDPEIAKGQIAGAVSVATAPKRDFATEMSSRVNSAEFQNQIWLMERGNERQYATNQMQAGMMGMGTPVVPGGTGIPGGGSETFLKDFSRMQRTVQAFESDGAKMLANLVPTELLLEYRDLGKEITTLSVEAGKIQADQAMRSYEMSVKSATYAVADLTALTGKGQGSVIGGLEKENLLMQRRLQMLQFESQQRSINFSVAVAGFQAAGLTGEERSARLDIAKREAEITQEQLDLGKGVFGNQIQIVDQQNLRSLEMATLNLRNVVRSFRGNNRLGEIGQQIGINERRKGQIAPDMNTALGYEIQLQQMRDQTIADVANYTKDYVASTEDFVKSIGVFKNTSEGPFEDAAGAFSSSITSVKKDINVLNSLMSGKAVHGLTVRDITIAPRITGTVVNYNELLKLIVEELGRQGVRAGNNGT